MLKGAYDRKVKVAIHTEAIGRSCSFAQLFPQPVKEVKRFIEKETPSLEVLLQKKCC